MSGERDRVVARAAPRCGSRRDGRCVRPLAAAVAVLALCLVMAPPAGAATGASCRLSLNDQGPPGGTPAYELKLRRRGASCGLATRLMKAFHRCRTEARVGCPKPLLGRWRCRGRRDGSGPGYFTASFTCRRGRARVDSSYVQSIPACFGAAARDPKLRCFSRARSVVPAVGRADPEQIWQCNPDPTGASCVSGASGPGVTRTVALVGDSHSAHWRAPLNVVAQLRRWRVHSHFSGGCFFSTVASRFTGGCGDFYGNTARWFTRHPEVSTVFVTANADTPIAIAEGEDMAAVKTAGFRRAFQALPPTVRQVIVLRDTPRSSEGQLSCAYSAIAARKRLSAVCPLKRSIAVRPDLAVAAVRGLRSRRYGYIDLTRFMCSTANCYPIVGGTRVTDDIHGHLNMTFMRTLTPYLMRAIRRLEALRRR
ncbi:MAG: SGNH hydrolase domain-containing protein [Thermoleophilia bacterium]